MLGQVRTSPCKPEKGSNFPKQQVAVTSYVIVDTTATVTASNYHLPLALPHSTFNHLQIPAFSHIGSVPLPSQQALASMTTFAAQPSPSYDPSSTSSESSHLKYLRKCLALAEKSPPRPTNFRVGALLVLRHDTPDATTNDKLLSTGYTLELPGNTHAEQSCLRNYAAAHNVFEEQVADAFPPENEREGRKIILYVTMEPCGVRLSGNTPCVQRIIQTRQNNNNNIQKNNNGGNGIDKVYFGVKEPGTFVGESQGCKMLTAAGIQWEFVPGLENEILAVATAGHEQQQKRQEVDERDKNIDDISQEEREKQPRNPKKRMMDTELYYYTTVFTQ
ncbi:cytidine deaminase-like protein [Talaromyces proteolyticus]|uniref:Cytidine deaminase-like protein n=1 Tax=Talaromyces proteolyticus TaxID=1131652 RepID=A0AAD4Q261_9EURO|nr:cytidine deaminase-like protein [Talaromyces proteolyticus]KAH8699283.1 cytidine deaminase-like protein [Talaromyces proteolyticus]